MIALYSQSIKGTITFHFNLVDWAIIKTRKYSPGHQKRSGLWPFGLDGWRLNEFIHNQWLDCGHFIPVLTYFCRMNCFTIERNLPLKIPLTCMETIEILDPDNTGTDGSGMSPKFKTPDSLDPILRRIIISTLQHIVIRRLRSVRISNRFWEPCTCLDSVLISFGLRVGQL